MSRFDAAREKLYESRTLYRLAGSTSEVSDVQWLLRAVSRQP